MRHRSRSLTALSALGIRPDPNPIASFSPFHSLAPSNAFVYHLYSALPAPPFGTIYATYSYARDSTTNKLTYGYTVTMDYKLQVLPEAEQ